jgi:homoaconitate hydratase
MVALRRAVALNAVAIARLQTRALTARTRSLALASSQYRTYKTSSRQHAFHSQLESTPTPSAFQYQKPPTVENPQTLVEKIAQQYAVGLAPGKKIKAGDYIALAPHHCMSHDNTWPIAKKFLDIGASKIHNNRQVGE